MGAIAKKTELGRRLAAIAKSSATYGEPTATFAAALLEILEQIHHIPKR